MPEKALETCRSSSMASILSPYVERYNNRVSETVSSEVRARHTRAELVRRRPRIPPVMRWRRRGRPGRYVLQVLVSLLTHFPPQVFPLLFGGVHVVVEALKVAAPKLRPRGVEHAEESHETHVLVLHLTGFRRKCYPLVDPS